MIHNLSNEDILNTDTFKDLSTKLKSKVQFLRNKFRPTIIPTHNTNRKKKRNRSSRERFLLRKFKKYFSDGGVESVINLSNTAITSSQKMLQLLGSGFIPTNSSRTKEEEMLVLEGLRVTSRIGDLDYKLTKELEDENNSNNNSSIDNNNSRSNLVSSSGPTGDSTTTASSSTESDDKFVRSKAVPYNLRYFQPKERTLRQGVTKLLQKEFDYTDQK